MESRILLLIILAVGLWGCDTSSPDVRKLTDEFSRTVDDARKRLSDLTPSKDDIRSLTTDELAKLAVFEYKVIDIKKDTSTQDMQEVLAALGQERWECFDTQDYRESLRFFCKRRPQTYLRYVPRMFP